MELPYEEIRDSMLDEIVERITIEEMDELSYDVTEEDNESDWSREMDELSSDVNDDGIHYYIQPVNEYENTELTVYENHMESGGYEDPVSQQKKQTVKENMNFQEDYEIPDVGNNLLKYDILSQSPEELSLVADDLTEIDKPPEPNFCK